LAAIVEAPGMATRASTAPGYRLRPTPRRRTSRRSGSRIHWDKLGRVALVLVLIAILASYVGPMINLVGSWQDRRSAAAELTHLRSQYENLHARAAAADGPDPAGNAARKLGMVSPGERSYSIKGLSN
jgi:cell division protein FtsB